MLLLILALALSSTRTGDIGSVAPASTAREMTDLTLEELISIKVTSISQKETTP